MLISNKTMRPDEHKKKQRADYKKKHGISNKKTPLKERNETPKNENNAQEQEKDVLGETEEGNQAQFSRRKVSSNWDRYHDLEGISDEDNSTTHIQQRGEDYSVLLQRSANPASQFRFQSEKDWDQETDASTMQIPVSALEVDFGALAACLNGVPLHQRLDIPANHLYPGLVKEFEFNAEVHRKNQSVSPWSSLNKVPDTNRTAKSDSRSNLKDASEPFMIVQSSQNYQHNLLEQSSSDSKQSANSSKSDRDLLKVKQTGCTNEPSKPHNVEDIEASLKDVIKTVNASSTNDTTGKKVESVNHEEDDELEFLLSLETPGDRIASSGHHSQVNPSSEVPSSSVTPSNQSANNADDDLEDWLDSVLG